jgi:hypothetical protein
MMAGLLAASLLCSVRLSGWRASLRPRVAASGVRHVPPLAVSDSVVAKQLNDVPVFGLLLTEAGTLYGDEEQGATMVYTSLADATRVLAQLKTAYPTTELELLPLPLGHVLTQAGHLQRATSEAGAAPDDAQAALRMALVASPEERRAARRLREDSAMPRPRARAGAAAQLQTVPVFHVGSVEHPSQAEAIWPFFFRTADVDALWAQLGDGAPAPTITATDLAALVDGLRQAEEAPAAPLICAPLDALAYVRERDSAVSSAIDATAVEALGVDFDTPEWSA